MKPIQMVILFAFFCGLFTGQLSAKDLKTYKETYEKSLEIIILEHGVKIEDLNWQYESALGNLEKKSQEAGDLIKLKSILAEMTRFRNEECMPASRDDLPEISKLQEAYLKHITQLENDRAQEIVKLANQYDTALAGLQKELTKEYKLEDATAVLGERKRVKENENYVSAMHRLSEETKSMAEAEKQQTIGEKPVLKGTHPPDAKQYKGHWYKVVNCGKPITWHEAKEQCEKMGGYLACAETEEEFAELINMGQGKELWLGCTDEKIEGNFKWLTGVPLSYTVKQLNSKSQKIRDYMCISYDGKPGCKTAVGSIYLDKTGEHPVIGYICEWDK